MHNNKKLRKKMKKNTTATSDTAKDYATDTCWQSTPNAQYAQSSKSEEDGESKMQNTEFDYDPENDDLFMHLKDTKSKGSIELGDIIIDYNSKMKIVGIEIMNASKLIRDVANKNLELVKNILTNLESCKMEIKPSEKQVIIRIDLVSGSQEILPVVSVPCKHNLAIAG